MHRARAPAPVGWVLLLCGFARQLVRGMPHIPLLVVLFEDRHLLILGAVLNHVGPSHIDQSLFPVVAQVSAVLAAILRSRSS